MKSLPLSLLLLLAAASVYAQSSPDKAPPNGFFNRWQARATATQARQPSSMVPLVTTYTGLIQVVRTDVTRQITPAHTNTWNLDNSKGINLVPWANTELAVDLPPYILHNSTARDGFGDMSFLGKYRIASGNERHGRYTLSAWVVATVPTGSHKNGSTDASVQPNLGGGKGFGNFFLQSTLGATLPTGKPAIAAAGRPILWNSVVQYRMGKLIWPEIESNATFFKGGTNDGRTQEFITPGLMFGKFKLHPDPRSRPGLSFGVGMQIATSRFHAYNHALLISTRWAF